jgi:hypothetical protein
MIDSFGNMATKKLQKTLNFRQFAKKDFPKTPKKKEAPATLRAGN